MKYLVVCNGAAIAMHDTLEQAMLQARLWKSGEFKYPTLGKRVIKVEEYHDHDWDKGFVRTFNDIEVELPMLVPSLTPRWDWDTLPYSATTPRHIVSKVSTLE